MSAVASIPGSRASDKGRFQRDGFQIVPGLVSAREAGNLATELSRLLEEKQTTSPHKTGGVRNLLRDNRKVRELACSPVVSEVLDRLTGKKAIPIRAILFDKNASANWLVPWHQDLTIAVMERIESPGFGAWSVKEGVVHVQPPGEILEGMVTARLHLDDCNAAHGALRVIPGSHGFGRLSSSGIEEESRKTACVCELARGDAMFMRPLLLHASARSDTRAHRRVLHIEYATGGLPNGLRWLESP